MKRNEKKTKQKNSVNEKWRIKEKNRRNAKDKRKRILKKRIKEKYDKRENENEMTMRERERWKALKIERTLSWNWDPWFRRARIRFLKDWVHSLSGDTYNTLTCPCSTDTHSCDTWYALIPPEKHAPGSSSGSFLSWSCIKDMRGETTSVSPGNIDAGNA